MVRSMLVDPAGTAVSRSTLPTLPCTSSGHLATLRRMIPCIALGLLLASGVVVESVAPGSPVEKVGLRPGDRLVSWSQAAETGTFRTPFDVDDVEGERAPRGTVR